ncbi:hypothetical protein PO124_32750 [Bacillus licheniformis]|nr:hypothetical protein [Bacillus licheniformis]
MEQELRESELKFRKYSTDQWTESFFSTTSTILSMRTPCRKILSIPLEQLKTSNLLDVISGYHIENAASPAKTISFEEMDNDIPFLLSDQNGYLNFI